MGQTLRAVTAIAICAAALSACGSSGATVATCTHALIAQYPHESHIPAGCNGLTQGQLKQAADKAAAYELNKKLGRLFG